VRISVPALCAFIFLVCPTYDLLAQPYDGVTYGFSLGLAYSPDDNLTSAGWNLGGTVEGLVGHSLELRATLGGIGIEGTGPGCSSEGTAGRGRWYRLPRHARVKEVASWAFSRC